MSKKKHLKNAFNLHHRRQYYEDAINRLIDGDATVGYVETRWKKFKQVRTPMKKNFNNRP